MASFADLKKNRNSLMDKITKEIKTDEKGSNYEDERMWKLTRDKSGNGFAVIGIAANINVRIIFSQYF